MFYTFFFLQFLKGPHMFAASIVRRAAELKAPFLQCLKYFHTISIVDLQGQGQSALCLKYFQVLLKWSVVKKFWGSHIV